MLEPSPKCIDEPLTARADARESYPLAGCGLQSNWYAFAPLGLYKHAARILALREVADDNKPLLMKLDSPRKRVEDCSNTKNGKANIGEGEPRHSMSA